MPSTSPQTNLDVDYVISYRIPNSGKPKAKAIKQFQQLIEKLARAGLDTEVRNGDETSLLVFIRAANETVLSEVVYRSRIRDWLHGVRHVQPVRLEASSLATEPLTDAERFRMIHHMITAPPNEGGAGITSKDGDWDNVESIFPLHDHAKNSKWLSEFTKKTFLTPDDLDQVRNTVGEKIAYYYAFLQSYFTFMIFPATFGLSCWLLLGSYSPIYAIVNGLWCVVFVEWWRRQESELAFRWGVREVSSIQSRRRQFQASEHTKDPITGEDVEYFPAKVRLQRQLLQIPLALASVISLGAVICTCYAIEIFLSEVYSGPLDSVLVYAPTVLLTLLVPVVSNFLSGIATRLTNYENYETKAAYEQAIIGKTFVINFITSYLAEFLTAFVYVPFAAILVPYLDVFGLTVRPIATNEKQIHPPHPSQFSIDPDRLKNQVIYSAITAQVVNFGMETVVPLLTQKGQSKIKQIRSTRSQKPPASWNDPADEKEFLDRVRHEADLPEYDVQVDLREMVIQFGHLALFSVIWPLTPICFFINNWVELRGDTFKLTFESKRPNPERADSIGPWLDSLEFLGWLGSVVSAALVYMFNGNGTGPDGRPTAIQLWALLLSILLSEHVYLLVRLGVRTAIAKLDTAAQRQERSERYMVRKRYLEEAGLHDALKPFSCSIDTVSTEAEDITRSTLEEDARRGSLQDSNASTRFWGRQKGWTESEQVGTRLIEMMDIKGEDEKKSQ